MYTKFYAPPHVALLITKFYCAKSFRNNKILAGLHGYSWQFGISIRSLTVAISVAAAIIFVNPVIAQPTFTQRTGVANPLDEQLVLKGRLKGSYPKPTFQDLDGDGTKDAIIGDAEGVIHYFKNTGTATAPKVADEGLIYREQFLSIDKIIREWECWHELLEQFQDEDDASEPDEGIKSNWWNPLWIPFTHDGCGNHICVDLDPDTKGKFGQVIRMWHDISHRELYATSFLEWFDNYVKGLETGEIVYAKDWGLVEKSSPFAKP